MDHIKELLLSLVDTLKETHRDVGLHECDTFETIGIGADGAPTSRIDDMLERKIVAHIERSGIAATILSEEKGYVQLNGGSDAIQFIIDPLDGTSNASIGFPFYATSIGVTLHGQIELGLIYNYSTEDLYYARRGKGAFLNDRQICVSVETDLKEAAIVTSKPFEEGERQLYSDWSWMAKRSRMTGCPALDCCFVAAGVFSAYIDIHMNGGVLYAHDLAAAAVIVKEAGGLLLDLEGNEITLSASLEHKHNIIAAANRNIAQQVRAVVAASGFSTAI